MEIALREKISRANAREKISFTVIILFQKKIFYYIGFPFAETHGW